MKTKYIFTVVFSMFCVFNILSAQTIAEKEQMLTKGNWTITGDRQAGIGRHNSMNENSKLKFNADSTWECTDPILGETKGIWYLKESNHIYLAAGKSKKAVKCDLILLNETQLHFKYNQNTAVRTLEWESVEE